MAMCKVLSHLGGGLYSVEVYLDDSGIATRIEELDKEITRLTNKISDYEVTLQAAFDDRNWYINRNNQLIPLLNSYEQGSNDWNAVEKDIQETTQNGLKARNKYISTKALYNQLIADKTALKVERTSLANRPALTNPILSVWCVDLADGVDGRAIYAANEESELWCLNYDAGDYGNAKYLLPPKNINISLVPNAQFNIPKAYPSLRDACMTFWNVAMEVGFSRWAPILMRGRVRDSNEDGDRDCTINEEAKDRDLRGISFTADGAYARFNPGVKLATGTVVASVNYFAGRKSMSDGDVVVAEVSVSSAGVITSAIILGFYSNPKTFEMPENYTSCTDIELSVLLQYITISFESPSTLYPVHVDTLELAVTEYIDSNGDYFAQKLCYADYSGGIYTPYTIGACNIIPVIYTGRLTRKHYGPDDTICYSRCSQGYIEFAGVVIPTVWHDYSVDTEADIVTAHIISTSLIVSVCIGSGAYIYEEEELIYSGPAIYFSGAYRFGSGAATVTGTRYSVDCEGVSTIVSTYTRESNTMIAAVWQDSGEGLIPPYSIHSIQTPGPVSGNLDDGYEGAPRYYSAGNGAC